MAPSNGRPRDNSVTDALHQIENDRTHHLTGPFVPGTPLPEQSSQKPILPLAPFGLWSDIKTMQWMTVPLSAFKILATVLVLWTNWHFLAPNLSNPFAPLIFLSYYQEDSAPGRPTYAKGPLDLWFLLYYVVVWSFVRQFLTIHVLRPLAYKAGVRKQAKLDRFGEQGYALIYFSFFGSLGIYVMSQLPTWWYQTEHFWIDYPHWRMTPLMKRYYLMQLSYWIQQLFILILRLEKPRKDFSELVIHHIVTIWLVGWSYTVNLTYIGNSIFMTMDISDIFLACAKLLNYMKMEKTANTAFAIFILVWTYLRHYLNIVILWSVWTEFDLIPQFAREWNPPKGVWMVWWMKYQIFIPIFLLQLVNVFWYFLILRILYRVLSKSPLQDERSDDEDSETEESTKDK